MLNENSISNWKTLSDERARGILNLDKNLFTFQLKSLVLEVPFESICFVNKKFKDLILKCPRLSEVKILNSSANVSNFKPIFLEPNKCLEIDQLKLLIQNDILDILENHSIKYNQYLVEFYYENWLYDEILEEILPKNVPKVAGYSIIGHIAHMNLRDEHLKYKNIIGEVILDKISNVKTVVNKIKSIDNTYRNFQMELLAGEENYVTSIKEHGFTYQLDFAKVYWNSRLSTEHQRITQMIPSNSLVFDLFAGVGPFSVPLAKKRCTVFANDLNPDSFLWLDKNMKLNKVDGSCYKLFNLDAREFILTIVKDNLIKYYQERDNFQSIHVIMNLPALAYTFVDAFKHLLPAEIVLNNKFSNSIAKNSSIANLDNNIGKDFLQEKVVIRESNLPIQLVDESFKDNVNLSMKNSERGFLNIMFHCYCFSKNSANPLADAKTQVESILQTVIMDNCDLRIVRNVAPNKEMVYIGFQLSHDILIENNLIDDGPLLKRLKTN